MQDQRATNAYSLAGQRAPPYGYTASRRRPPAIPVRSQVATQTLRPQPLVTAHHLLAGMLIVGVKTVKGCIDHLYSVVRENSKWCRVLKTQTNKQNAIDCQPSLKFIFDRKVFQLEFNVRLVLPGSVDYLPLQTYVACKQINIILIFFGKHFRFAKYRA